MGLLDGGLADVFSSVFSQFLLDGTLYVPNRVSDGKGGFITGEPTPHSIKGMVDSYSAVTMLAAQIPATDSKLLVLQNGVAVEPKVGYELTLGGYRWKVIAISQDPARAAWTFQGRKIG
jgi:hypothetical protein